MRKRSSFFTLGRRLFFATLAGGFLVMTVITGLRGWVTSIRTRERFVTGLQAEALAHHEAISEALWGFDRRVLAAQIHGMTLSPYISYASVKDDSGDFLEAGTKREGGGFELSVPVVHEDGETSTTIGTLTLQADLEKLKDITWTWAIEDLPIIAVGLALVAAFLYLYFARIVTRRLEEDAERLRGFKLDGVELPFPNAEKIAGSEIETLEMSFNELSSRLRDSYRTTEAARGVAETSERRYQAIFDHSPVALCLEDFSAVRDFVWSLNPGSAPGEAEAFFAARPELVDQCAAKAQLLAVNGATLQLFGAESIDQLRGAHGLIALQGNAKVLIAKIAAMARGETRAGCEGDIETIHGETRRVATYWEALADDVGKDYGRAILALMDVTDRVKAQENLSANLREKEVLIRELFHRTKNNMQSILALISFQSWKSADETLREALRALETRVYSMSLVHRMLYQYNDLSRLSLSAFIREFSAYLSASEDIEKRSIRFEQRMEEIEVTVDIAVPFGLIIAELVDNALNHAFPDKRGGVITIELLRTDDDLISLTIEDDGVGARPDFQPDSDGMGLQLVKSLAESQLGGVVEFESPPNGGFRCRILAQPDLYTLRV